jgi:hypothetical protein
MTTVDVPGVGDLSPWDAATLANLLMAQAHTAAGWRTCQYCPAPLIMATTEQGKPMPVNPGTDPRGNLALSWRDGRTRVRGVPLDRPLAEGERRVMSHFASCPGSQQARKPRPPRSSHRSTVGT